MFHDEILRKRIKFHITQLPGDSKPGVPYSALGNTNKDIWAEHEELMIKLTIERLRKLALGDLSNHTAQQLVHEGFCDPVSVFIKGEPHSSRKLESKRWRLIMAISAVDQMVERLLSNDQNKKEISMWNRIPSAPGIGLSDDAELRKFYERVRKAADGPLAEADVTGWDWSVQEWELLFEAELRASLCGASPMLTLMLRNREICAAMSLLALPDGRLIQKLHPGVQPSGRYNTSSTNSRLRVSVAYLVGAKWAFANGDDCLEDPVEDAKAKYAALGHPLKMYEIREEHEPFEFCSTLFTDTTQHPVDGTKTLYNLLEQKDISKELLEQFSREMRFHPRRGEFLALVEQLRGRPTDGQDDGKL